MSILASPTPNRRWLRPRRCPGKATSSSASRSEEHTSELQSQSNLVCRLLLEKKNNTPRRHTLYCRLPYSHLKHIILYHLTHVASPHGFAHFFVRFENGFRIFEMCRRFHSCLRARLRIAGLENPRSNEYRFRAQTTH